MSRLPIIVGMGGVNPAGRISGHHAYRRMIFEALGPHARQRTLTSLARLMGIEPPGDGFFSPEIVSRILAGTLIRRIESSLFNPDAVPFRCPVRLQPNTDKPVDLLMAGRDLPRSLPSSAVVREVGPGVVHLTSPEEISALFPSSLTSRVQSAGQLPSGFAPGALYPSRAHPKGLQLSIYAASDAFDDMGINWDVVRSAVRPDEIAVYACSAMGQLDDDSGGGLMSAFMAGRRITSKQVPFSLPEMPANFVNAYVLGNVGGGGGKLGACATFLYNLELGVDAIRSGRSRLVLVGSAEAPLVPEVIEGYRTMRALAEDHELCELDGLATPDYRRACRPFAPNCGFVMAESGIFVALMDDALALELGACVLGSVSDVFVNADGCKKSISSPGLGNYITVGKALAAARRLLGDRELQGRTYVQAHGTGTPQNRVTESDILSRLAGAFKVRDWPVAAIKAYVGHSLGPAGGDQLAAALGLWEDGVLPGIKTIDQVADDVCQENLHFPLDHLEVGPERFDAAFINSKGFGGNNATAVVLAPHRTREILESRHGKARFLEYARKNEETLARHKEHDEMQLAGDWKPTYRLGETVLEGSDIEITDQEIRIPGYSQPILLGALEDD